MTSSATFDRYHLLSTLLAKGIGRRLHFDNHTSNMVEGMLKFHTEVLGYETAWPDKQVRRLVRDLDPLTDRIVDFAALLQATTPAEGADASAVEHLRARLDALKQSGRLRPSLPSGLGKVVMRHFDLPSGPGVGEVLGWLNEAIIDGRLESDLDPSAYVHYLEAERPQVLNRARELAGPSRRTKGHGTTS